MYLHLCVPSLGNGSGKTLYKGDGRDEGNEDKLTQSVSNSYSDPVKSEKDEEGDEESQEFFDTVETQGIETQIGG